MPEIKTHVIFNPVAGGGRAGKDKIRILKEINQRLGEDYTICITRYSHEATESARLALNSGVELIIVVGGDGTVHETVNGFFKDGSLINSACKLGIITYGTSNGLGQSLDLPKEIDRQLDVILEASGRTIDLGRLVCHDLGGDKVEWIIADECQIGIGGEVVRGVKSSHKRLGGFLAFASVSLSKAVSYRPQSMTVIIDDEEKIERSLIGVVVGNGRYCGGGMLLTPQAEPDDGLFDVLLMHKMSVFNRMLLFPQIYKGKHIRSPLCSYLQGKHIFVETDEPVPIAADGEFLGVTPCEIELLPAVLKVGCEGL